MLEKHPALADELKSFFANRAALERIAEPLKGAAYEATMDVGPGSDFPPGEERQAGSPSHETVRYVGDYELLEEIARGGMGVVYKARQASLNRTVAVKMILAGQFADESAVKRFRREAEAAANLDHSHIVPVYEVGEHQGQHYFSMGFVDGQSLAARLAGGPLAPRAAAELMEQVARAVHYAHERGVIHRDLKPANVLLDRDGRPKVTDFGLAKLTTREQSLTDTGQVLGTPGYMPPEQIDGKTVEITADVYGLGAILYALLTGRPPFQAATLMETLQQVKTAEPVPPRQMNPSVPRDLDTIARKCLEKWPDWRYASAAELADELKRFLAGEPIRARRRGFVEQGARWIARQRRSVLTAAAAAVVSALLIVGGAFGTISYRKSLEGNLKLVTDHERLVAAVFDDHDRPAVEPFTVPTEQPIALTDGAYRLRTSGKNLLSEDFTVRLDRGENSTHELSLDWQRLWPEIAVDEEQVAATTSGSSTWHLVHCRGQGQPAHLLLLGGGSEVTFELRDMRTGKRAWSVTHGPPPELDLANRDKWLSSQGGLAGKYEPSGIGQTDFRPYVLPSAPQLDGDQECLGDIVIALRHQPALLAFSSEDGRRLWSYAPEFSRLTVWPGRSPFPRWFGTVVGEPLVMPDLDGDGVVDFLIGKLVLNNTDKDGQPIPLADQPCRTIDAVSGKTGKQIWQYELDDRWFDLPKGVQIPLASRWFAAPQTVSTLGSDWIAPHGNVFRNFVYRISGDGEEIFRQSPPLLMREQGKNVVACVAGSRVVVLDAQTGQPTSPPHDLGFVPVRPPQAGDVNGDDDDDLVLVERVGDSTHQIFTTPALQRAPSKQRLWCWSPDKHQPLWPPIEQSADYEKHVRVNQPPPAWPLVVDLNGDGNAEIIAPDGTSTHFGATPISDRNERAWGELQLIDGTDGKQRWRRRLQTVDQQVDQLIVGPDIDGDGWRDIFAATLFGRETHIRPPQLYVDAISGRDGLSLWHSGRPIAGPGFDEMFIDVLNWWSAGPDGWPQLVVSVRYGGAVGEPIVLACFSAGNGRITRENVLLDPPLIADGDGDGVNDLFCFTPHYRPAADRGGKLFSFRGTSPRVWRRLGGDWQAGRDYDGDGFDDVVARSVQAIQGKQRIVALSGRTGHELYRTAVEASLWNGTGAIIRPLAVDLDGDGVSDLLSTAGIGNNANNPPPILAFSGKTGRELWQESLRASEVKQTLFVRAADLDADGQQEVIYVAEMLLQDDAVSQAKWHTPVLLLVLDGSTGRLKWKQQISEGSNLAGDMVYQNEVPLSVADLNADGVADIVTPAFLEGLQLELRAYDGRAGNLLWRWETSQQQGSGYGAHWFSWQRTPIPLADDLDGDGRQEVVCLDFVSLDNSVYRLTTVDGASGNARWSHEIGGAGSRWPWHDRPRPLAVSLGEKQRGVVYWNWDSSSAVGEVGGEVVVLMSDGTEYWRFPRSAGTGGFNPRVSVADLDRDGRDELVLIDAGGVEALDLAARRRLWRHECPPSVPLSIRTITVGSKSQPPVVELFAGRTMLGLSGNDGQTLWTCAGLPRELNLQVPVEDYTQRLGSANGRFPTAFLCEVRHDAGDTVCLQAEPTAHSGLMPLRSTPEVAVTIDPRFARLLPWQLNTFGWPTNSPVWLALGMCLYLPALIVLPFLSLYKIAWQRRWSLRFWLLLPLVVSLVVIALITPAPLTAPPMPTLQAKFLISLLFLPIAAFPWQLSRYIRAGRPRRVVWWLVTAAMFSVVTAAILFAVQWRDTPVGEYWLIDWTWLLPFAGGLYLFAMLAMAFVAVEHFLWRPLSRTITRRRATSNG
ncbi:MAG: protein kinase [Pirellulales bacterium]